jgi:hypothetical protein
MPDPAKILPILRRAAVLCRATPGRKGAVVHLDDDAEEVMVVGDLHGNLTTFKQVLALADLARRPKRHLVLQELVHGPFYYPDEGGDRSHQLVDVVAALKCQHPDRVHLILGNHELSELTGRSIGKNGVYLNALFQQGIETAYGARAGAVRAAYLELFAALPLAVRTPNRVFICHTIPNGADLDRFDPEVLAGRAWTDEDRARGGTVYAITWGRDTAPETSDRFAGIVDADLFVNGHQPCDEGYRRANERQLIVDGTDPCPACVVFPARGPITMEGLLQGVKLVPLPSL